MSSWAIGPFGLGPWGGGGSSSLNVVRNLQADTGNPGQIVLNWKKPANYNTTMELILVRRKDAFPMELFNDDALFSAQVDVSGFTDPVQVEIFRGNLIRAANGVGSLNTLTDSGATFPTSPSLAGRILRDSQSHNFRIISNTSTVITIENGTPADGPYVVLVDFPNTNNVAISGTSTSVGPGFLTDITKRFDTSTLSDRILVDSNGDAFVIYDNLIDTIIVSGTPAAGEYTVLQEFNDFISPSETVAGQFQFIDNYLNAEEAEAQEGTGLEPEQFYYYTAFNHVEGKNVAQVNFGLFGSNISTQAFALSVEDREFHEILLKLWPEIFKQGDQTGDFTDLMKIFGFGLNEMYSYVNTFDLVNADKMISTLTPEMAAQTGISVVDYQLGVDTLRRYWQSMLPTYRLKGSKRGIVDFIRIVTTWDATLGTGDPSEIIDDLSGSLVFRFWSDTLGNENTRLFGFKPSYINFPFVSYTYSSGTGIIQYSSSIDLSDVSINDTFEDGAGDIFDIVSVDDANDRVTLAASLTIDNSSGGNIYEKIPLADAGRFFSSVSGILIPGFFDFKEFVVKIKDVAMFVGESTDLQTTANTTTLTDASANFGGTNNLVGNFLLPKQGQINDMFEIVANTTTTITVLGVAKDPEPVGDYAVLSPLNAVRFQRINKLMGDFAPSFARMGLQFV